MVVNKIKFWARIGQIAYFIFIFAEAGVSLMHHPLETLEVNAEIFANCSACVALIANILLSEAIVRLIIYFAELIEQKNYNNEDFEDYEE